MTSWNLRILGRTAAQYEQMGMMTTTEYLAAQQLRQAYPGYRFGITGSHAETPTGIYGRELMVTEQVPTPELAKWRIEFDLGQRPPNQTPPTYGDIEVWSPDGPPSLSFIKQLETIMGKPYDPGYFGKWPDASGSWPPGIYFDEFGNSFRVKAPWDINPPPPNYGGQ